MLDVVVYIQRWMDDRNGSDVLQYWLAVEGNPDDWRPGQASYFASLVTTKSTSTSVDVGGVLFRRRRANAPPPPPGRVGS